MKRIITLLALIPFLGKATRSYNGIEAYSVYLCEKGCWIENFWNWDWINPGDILHISDVPFTCLGSFNVTHHSWNGNFPIFNHGNTSEKVGLEWVLEVAGENSREDLFIYHNFSKFLNEKEYWTYMGSTMTDPYISKDIRKKK